MLLLSLIFTWTADLQSGPCRVCRLVCAGGRPTSLLSLSGLTNLETWPVEVTCYYQKQWFPNLVFKDIFRQNSSVTKQMKGKLSLAKMWWSLSRPSCLRHCAVKATVSMILCMYRPGSNQPLSYRFIGYLVRLFYVSPLFSNIKFVKLFINEVACGNFKLVSRTHWMFVLPLAFFPVNHSVVMV